MLNLEELLLDISDAPGFDAEPDVLPPTILDCERATGCFDMMIPLADPCPNCGAFRMQVGDWVCYGVCGVCYEKTVEGVC